MLTFLDAKKCLFRLAGVTKDTNRADITSAVKIAIQRAQTKFVLANDWGFLEQYQDRVDIPLSAPYETGTVTVTIDSKTVTGVGTTFTKDMEGSYFQITSGEWYEIRTFTSTTVVVLTIPYQSATDTTQTFRIAKRFYNLPLNMMRPRALEAKLREPGSQNEVELKYNRDASFRSTIDINKPTWFSIIGNKRGTDYFNTGTVTISTTASVSTGTISSGTLPTDIVDREFRIVGEERSYYINARTAATTFTLYETYYNPSDATNVATAASYAITPKETQLIGFSDAADARYIFSMPYIKRLPDLIADSDISQIVLAGFEDAFLAVCTAKFAEDFRSFLTSTFDRQSLINAGELALAEAMMSDVHNENMQFQASGASTRRQAAPSWLG